MSRFADRSILVTGAGSGIGRATARLFAAEGGRVVVVDVNAADAEKTVALIKEEGGEAFAVAADVSRDADCRATVERTVAAYGRLDVAFNNAGVGASGFALADEEEVTFDRGNVTSADWRTYPVARPSDVPPQVVQRL